MSSRSQMGNRPNILMREGNDAILEYRPGRFAEVCNGKVVSPLSTPKLLQLIHNLLERKMGKVDTGILEVSLALVAVCAVIASGLAVLANKQDPLSVVETIVAFLAFLLSVFASGRLFFSFLILQFPQIYLETRVRGWGYGGLTIHYLSLFVKILRREDVQRNETEFAYLSILGAFALVWLAATAWISLSLGRIFL